MKASFILLAIIITACIACNSKSNSDNITSKVDLVIPSNNRGRKALATVYWLLTKEVLKKQGKIKSDSEMSLTIDDFEAKLVEELI